jgi:hypothetical protein
MLVTQQMAVIDQIHNNQFQQQVTNQSRTEAGLSTITVQDSDLLTKIKSNVTNVGTFQGQVAGSSAAIGAITQAGSQALSYTTTWLGSTVIGSWFVDQYTAMKLKIASAFGINQGVNDTSTAGVSTTNAAKIVTSSAPVYNTSTTS